MPSCFGHRHSRPPYALPCVRRQSRMTPASRICLRAATPIAEPLRVKCGFLDAMRFRQAEHIDSRDFGGISSAGKGHCVPGVVDRLRSGRNPIGVVLIALESGI